LQNVTNDFIYKKGGKESKMPNTMKIREKVEEREMTYKELAKLMEMSAYTLRRKIKNIVPMTIEEAERMSNILDIKDEEFSSIFLKQKLQNTTN
jgi:transcriptional regulator with XRE-family HTH domain